MWVNFGVERVALIGYGTLLAIGALNLILWLLGRPGFGVWVQAWARKYTVLAALMALFVGALVGHFYWATPPPDCRAQTSLSLASAEYPHCKQVTAPP